MSGGDWKDLFGAAVRGDVELVRFHAERGVDLDFAHPEYQETALVAAILAHQEPVAHLLLDLGADPHLVSAADELTPLEAARRVGMAALEHRLRDVARGRRLDGGPVVSAGPTPRTRRRPRWASRRR